MPRCKLCKDKFNPKYFLQKMCMEKEECIAAEIELKKATIWKDKRKEWKIETHAKEHKKALQDEINKLSRMIDTAQGFNTCIDCGTHFGANQIDACHLHSRGANSTLKYNLHNLHSGHNHCNVWNTKHEGNYKMGLEKRYGKDYLLMVENLPVQYPVIHLSNFDVNEKLILVRKIIRNFETYSFKNGLSAREIFNKIIGIY